MHRGRPSPRPPARPALQHLTEVMLGRAGPTCELPPVTDLTACATSLAKGVRKKALLPLGSAPVEFALVRRGERVLVSCYETGSVPEVHLWNRPVNVRTLLDVCARAALESARLDGDPNGRRLAVRLAERALRSEPVSETSEESLAVVRRGGTFDPPADGTPLAFGFTASLFPGQAAPTERSLRADVHALLFDGSLWAHVRGRRIMLARGPIMLAVQRMVDAARALVDAWEAGRPANVRLRSGGFRIGVRLDRAGEAVLTLGTQDDEVTATGLDVPTAALPILRLASDLLRAFVSVDRSQSRNLRVRTLREEVRRLRRAVKARNDATGFVNRDPDRLRTGTLPGPEGSAMPSDPATTTPTTPAAALRFSERWRFELEGLDASSTFLCGDRLIVATPRHTLALQRDQGDVLWARDGAGTMAWMADTVLVRVSNEGLVELCDVEDGEPFAHARIAPPTGHRLEAFTAGGGSVPPVAILTEGPRGLVAIDLRTGEPRWRFSSRGDGALRVQRSGRVVLVACGEGAVSAVDVATGEVAWRFGDRTRFRVRPAVCGETAVVAAGDPGSEQGTLYGLDLYRGEMRWCRPLPGGPSSHPVTGGGLALVSVRDQLLAFGATDGTLRWTADDPGLSRGGASMILDGGLIVNAPAGRVTAIQLDDGSPRWTRSLADPVADDVPRRLEPVLRGGALFVPAASVHVIRPSDGASLGEQLPCELVPDLLRVDERGWVYVVEESGQVAALAPAPRLRLIQGG